MPLKTTSTAPAVKPAGGRPLSDFNADRRLLVLVAMALVVGSASLAAAWALIKLIAVVTNLVWFQRFDFVSRSLAHAHRGPWMVAAPALGGLIIGLMARFGSEKIRGHGIPEAIEAILIGGSRMSPKVAVLKPLSSAISIGTGGPFGAEGPIIMTGGTLGSLFAQCFHLSASERKTLLVAGAAAGMTAIFGTPVAAVLLALELLLFEWRPRSFVPVAAAAMVATLFRPMLFPHGPLFPFSGALDGPWWELAACVGVGLLSGLLSGALTKTLYILEDGFERLPIHWMWWPALGGLVVGLGGLIEPRVLGVGYDLIGDLLVTKLAVIAVGGVLLVKAAVWLTALSSGTSGGVLAPLLIIGGAAGWLLGQFLPGAPGTWALMGMAAMMGGTMRSPLTGAIFAMELTGDLKLLPALLAASTTAFAVTVLLMRRSILTEKIARRGQHVAREYGVDPFEVTRVADIMVREVDTIPAALSVDEAVAVLEEGEHRIYPVLDEDRRPVALVSRNDALHWKVEGVHGQERVGERLAGQMFGTVTAEDIAVKVLEIMLAGDQGRVPVVDGETGALVGLVTRKDLLRIRAAAARGERERRSFLPRRLRPRVAQTT